MTERNTPTMASLLSEAMESRLELLHVAIPARVESYDPTKRAISAQPLIKRGYIDEDGNRALERMPVITDVPVIFPGSGGHRIRFPINKGDTVLLVFAEGSLDRWLTLGGEVDPADDRRHSLSDAVAIPGLMDFKSADDADPMIEFTDSEIRAGGTNRLVTKAEFDAHLHSGVTTGGGASGPPTSPATGTAKLRG